MPHTLDTTSWALALLKTSSFTLHRQFIVGSSDYSDRVMRWPKIDRTWDDVRPRDVSVSVANDDAQLNLFRNQKLNLRTQCELSLTLVNTFSTVQFYSGSMSGTYTRHFIHIDSNHAFNTSSNQAVALEAIIYPDMSMPAGGSGLITGIGKNMTGYPAFYLKHRVLASGSHQIACLGTYSDGSGDGIGATFPTAPNSYTPYHCLAVMTDSSIEVYIDGSRLTWLAHGATALWESTFAWIGSYSATILSSVADLVCRDRVAQVRFWNRYITDSVATELAVESISDETNLAAWYDLNEGYGNIVYDISSNSNDGLLSSQGGFRLPEWMYVPSTDELRGTPVQNKTRLQLGVVSGVEYDDGTARITVADKFKQLGERVIGTNDAPVDYTGSDYLPSDLAWYAVTSYGGLSSVQATSNPDIDYASFLEWGGVFSGDNVIMRAYYDGQRVTEALRKIARMTESAIYISDGKLTFHRFAIAQEVGGTFNSDNIIDLSLNIDDSTTVNRQLVEFDYNVSSRSFAKSVVAQNTTSVYSYSLREALAGDETVWYVDSISALNFAQRRIFVRAEPFDQIGVATPLYGLPLRIGDRVTINDAFFGIADSYRIMEASIDMDTLKLEFGVDQSQFANGFRLDYSALDSSDVLV